MPTDEELLIHDVLNNNWNTSNAALPKFYYDDSLKLHDFNSFDAIKIYEVSRNEIPKSLGYTSYHSEVFLTIDVRSKSRSRMLQTKDEIIRIIRTNRKTLTGYNIFKMTHERKIASYLNFYQYVLEVSLLNYITNI